MRAVIDAVILWAGTSWLLARYVPSHVHWAAFWRQQKRLNPDAFSP